MGRRFEFKLLLYTYRALHGLVPGYMCELVVPYVPLRVLRSAQLNLLTIPPGKSGKYGSRSFVRTSVLVIVTYTKVVNTTASVYSRGWGRNPQLVSY